MAKRASGGDRGHRPCPLDDDDLDPDDGISPSITFPVGRPGIDVAVNLPSLDVFTYDPTTNTGHSVIATTPFGAVSTSSSVPGASGAAAYAGDPLAGGASFQATASATDGAVDAISRALLSCAPR